MKIIILGGSGFIGGYVAQALSKLNHKVSIYDLKRPSFDFKSIKYIKGNINDFKTLSKAISGQDIVYNFAAVADIDEAKNKPIETIKTNIEGTTKILNACKHKNIKKIIHASSIYANSKEGGYYAISKRAAEDYIEEFCRLNKLKFIILRFGSLYGYRAQTNNGIQRILTNLVKRKILIYRGKKNATRKYINVEDAANHCIKVLKNKYANKCLNITGNKNIKINKLIKNLSKKYKIKNIKFLNEKDTSHYVVKPTPYRIRESKNLIIKNEKDFFESIYKLVERIKKK